MQKLWLYSTKWSFLNKDKIDCRTFQLVHCQKVRLLVYTPRHLKRGWRGCSICQNVRLLVYCQRLLRKGRRGCRICKHAIISLELEIEQERLIKESQSKKIHYICSFSHTYIIIAGFHFCWGRGMSRCCII